MQAYSRRKERLYAKSISDIANEVASGRQVVISGFDDIKRIKRALRNDYSLKVMSCRDGEDHLLSLIPACEKKASSAKSDKVFSGVGLYGEQLKRLLAQGSVWLPQITAEHQASSVGGLPAGKPFGNGYVYSQEVLLGT